MRKQDRNIIDFEQDIDFSKESRIPPYSTDIEQEVLACVLLDDDPIEQVIQIFGESGGDVFYERRHQIIFKAMMQLYTKRQAIDLITVSEELVKLGELDNIGGRHYLAELSGKVISAANVEYYARLAKEKYLYRRMISISTKISESSYSSSMDIFDLVEHASQQFFNISQAGIKKKATPIKDLVKNGIRMLETLRASQSSITGIGSGFSEVDQMTAGFQQSDMIIIAARPSAGKTAFALALARNAAVDFETPVLFFSLEMAEVQLAIRLMCAEASVESQLVRTGRISQEMMGRIINNMDKLNEAKLFIDDTPGISIMELTAKARRLKQEHNIGMVVVDYLQLVSPVRDGKSNREQEIAQISRSLKALAKELNIPVIALAQLNRSVEQRSGDRRPQLSDLRESGSIEQDADVVMFLSRPEMYGKQTFEDGSSTKDVVEIVIGKQRNGPIGDIRLLFLKNYGRFQSMANAYVTAGVADDSYGNPDGYPPQAAEFSSEGDIPFVNPDESPFNPLSTMQEKTSEDPHSTGSAMGPSSLKIGLTSGAPAEDRYTGIAASRGIAIGECYSFEKEMDEPQPEVIEEGRIEEEVERFTAALGRSEKELRKIERVTIKKLGKGYSNLFQAQIMILQDPVLTDAISNRIRTERRPANLVIEEEFNRHLEHFRNSDDPLFQERADDLTDIKDRIIRNLQVRKLHSWIPEGVIVASDHLSPADIILLSRSNVKGFVTDTGGKTSHISLICKSLKLPMVVGLGKFSQKVSTGRKMIIDGRTGTVVTDPTDETVAEYMKRQEEELRSEEDASRSAVFPATTKCGVRIGFYANIDFREELDTLCEEGAEGVGLFRSENLFTDASKVPTEAEQENYYFQMADAIAPMPLDIRLFDIGGDKLMYSPVKEPNPNLGWRGIRILLDLPEILEAQITAILKANSHGNIDILVPMIMSLDEIAQVRAIVDRAFLELTNSGLHHIEKPGIGAMIEVPAAVELIDEITRAVDFISIGTNDLTQYTLAVDRNNVIVQDLFEKFHPALIRQLYRIISTAQKNRRKAVICGDMGSDPLALPFLLGCGLRHFSVVSSDIAKLKSLVGCFTLEETEALARDCLQLTSPNAIKERLEAFGKG